MPSCTGNGTLKAVVLLFSNPPAKETRYLPQKEVLKRAQRFDVPCRVFLAGHNLRKADEEPQLDRLCRLRQAVGSFRYLHS